MSIVDIAGWETEERFSPYPEGSRDKYAVISPNDPADGRIVPNHRYLVKFSNARYPVQFWSEIIAEIIGRKMGVPVPACFLTIDPDTGEPASLISWFYGEAIERHAPLKPLEGAPHSGGPDLEPKDVPHSHSLYIPGSNYMARYIHDYDLEKGKQHNIETLFRLVSALRIKYKIDFWPLWCRYITFDAIIGNTDRHQDNWGILWRRSESAPPAPRFAPAFDNGTSLLHEILDRKLPNFHNDAWRGRYIMRGTHHLRRTADAERQLGHLEAIGLLCSQYPSLRLTIEQSFASFNLEELEDEIMALCDLPSPVPLIADRVKAIMAVVRDRQNRILEIVTTS